MSWLVFSGRSLSSEPNVSMPRGTRGLQLFVVVASPWTHPQITTSGSLCCFLSWAGFCQRRICSHSFGNCGRGVLGLLPPASRAHARLWACCVSYRQIFDVRSPNNGPAAKVVYSLNVVLFILVSFLCAVPTIPKSKKPFMQARSIF